MSHGFSLQTLIPISLVLAVCSQSSFACGISHFISEFQFNLEFNLEFTFYLRVVIVAIFIGRVVAVLQQRKSLVLLGLFPLT